MKNIATFSIDYTLSHTSMQNVFLCFIILSQMFQRQFSFHNLFCFISSLLEANLIILDESRVIWWNFDMLLIKSYQKMWSDALMNDVKNETGMTQPRARDGIKILLKEAYGKVKCCVFHVGLCRDLLASKAY